MNALVRALPQHKFTVTLYSGGLALLGLACFAIIHQMLQLLPEAVEYWLRQNCMEGICASSDLTGDALFITLLTTGVLAMTFAWLVIAAIEHLYNEHLRTPSDYELNLIDPFVPVYGIAVFIFALLIGLTIAFA